MFVLLWCCSIRCLYRYGIVPFGVCIVPLGVCIVPLGVCIVPLGVCIVMVLFH